MGSGFKDFVAGTVLTEADLDGYLMRQTVMTFADSSARDAALSGVLDEGMVVFLEDDNLFAYYDGSSWVPWSSAWISLSPSYNNLSIGNGTANLWYKYVAGDIRIKGGITWGSTTSASGEWGISLPNSLVSGAFSSSVGTAIFVDNSAPDAVGVSKCSASSTDVTFATSANVSVTASAPFTWATSDIVLFDITVGLV